QVLGRSWREIFNWHPNESSDEGPALAVPAMTRFEVECKDANGNRLVLGMTVSPLHEQDEPHGLVGVFKDLTQIRDLEEEMRRKEWLPNICGISAGVATATTEPLRAT